MAERARLQRLQRLERVRAIAKQAAAIEAAEAEGTLAQFAALARRTEGIAADYACRGDAHDGLALRQLAAFAEGLHAISASTRGDAAQARMLADRKQAELARAERRRAAIEDRAALAAKALATRHKPLVLEARRAVGTGLDWTGAGSRRGTR